MKIPTQQNGCAIGPYQSILSLLQSKEMILRPHILPAAIPTHYPATYKIFPKIVKI